MTHRIFENNNKSHQNKCGTVLTFAKSEWCVHVNYNTWTQNISKKKIFKENVYIVNYMSLNII